MLPAFLVPQAEHFHAKYRLEPRADVPHIFLILCKPPSPPPCWEVGSPRPCEGFASSLSHGSPPPRLHPGLFTDPHYFQSPSLVKSNLATYYRSDKTALGSASPDEGPGSFRTFITPPPRGLPSLWANPLSEHTAGRSQPQLAAFAKGQEF